MFWSNQWRPWNETLKTAGVSSGAAATGVLSGGRESTKLRILSANSLQ